MEPRKKPIPAPLPRATSVRALVAATSARALPTVAALLAATSLLACSSVGSESPEIAPDQQVMRATLHAQPAPVQATIDPLPGMGALEAEVELPAPTPTTKPVIKPSPVPIMPAGAPRPIAPVPTAPKLAGKIAPIHTKSI